MHILAAHYSSSIVNSRYACQSAVLRPVVICWYHEQEDILCGRFGSVLQQ